MTRRIPRVYVAGPYTARPHWAHRIPLLGRWLKRRAVVRNIRNAVDVGVLVAKAGLYPVIHHANTADARFEEAQGYEFWIETTLDALRTCDAIVMADGWEESSGARGEYNLALELGLPHAVLASGGYAPRDCGGDLFCLTPTRCCKHHDLDSVSRLRRLLGVRRG